MALQHTCQIIQVMGRVPLFIMRTSEPQTRGPFLSREKAQRTAEENEFLVVGTPPHRWVKRFYDDGRAEGA